MVGVRDPGISGSSNTMKLGLNCINDWSIAHEFIHTFGFWHEHQRQAQHTKMDLNIKSLPKAKDYQYLKVITPGLKITINEKCPHGNFCQQILVSPTRD